MKKIALFLILVIITSCASTNSGLKEPSPELKEIISQASLDISPRWATPQLTISLAQLNALGATGNNGVGSRIDIRGNTSYFRFSKDSVSASLPFFGDRHFGSLTSNIDQGINFDGVPEDLKIEQEGANYKIWFKIRDKNLKRERYDVYVKVNSKLVGIIDINSTHRSSMSYEGRIEEKDDETASL